MRTSATCRTPDRTGAGFSLLEILMVLILMGLVGSLVIPRVSTLYDRFILQEQLDNMLHQIEDLPFRVYHSGASVSLGGGAGPVTSGLNFEDGWSMYAEKAIHYKPNGVCTGGEIELHHDTGRGWRYQLLPPFCRPEAADAGE